MIKTIAISLLLVLLLFPLFFNRTIIEEEQFGNDEKFDPSLKRINTIASLINYIDSTASIKNIKPANPGYAVLTEEIISRKFYHGFSHLKMSENWIANISQKVTGLGLATKIFPKDIIESPNAACSQQALVLMEVLKEKKINYRNVAFPHHYALEAQYKNDWYFLDADMEPAMSIEERNRSKWKGANDSLKKFYSAKHIPFLDYRFGNGLTAGVGPVNENPAQNLKLFQRVTGFASRFLWILPLGWLFYSWRKKRALSRRHTDSVTA